ncbi:MAG: ABC-2 transporter permease [Bacillota bacterium]|jgi:ABC-2 type transport system permease protein
MKGLLIKDLLVLKNQARITLIIILFFGIMSASGSGSSAFGLMITLFFAILPITALAYDERAKWPKYALTMPLSRTDLVLSKYILGLIFCAAAFVLNIIFQSLTDAEFTRASWMIALALLSIGIVLLSVLLPIMFKFGVEKGRLLMLLILFIPTGLIVFLSKKGVAIPGVAIIKSLAAYAPLIIIAALVLSFLLSLHIYQKKEMQ